MFAEPQPYYLPQDEAESGSLLALDESPKEEECYQDLEIPGIVTPPYNENNPTLPYPSTPTVGEGTEGFPAGENYEACMAAMAKARPDLLRECEISWGPNSRNADTEKLEFCKSEVNKTMDEGEKQCLKNFSFVAACTIFNEGGELDPYSYCSNFCDELRPHHPSGGSFLFLRTCRAQCLAKAEEAANGERPWKDLLGFDPAIESQCGTLCELVPEEPEEEEPTSSSSSSSSDEPESSSSYYPSSSSGEYCDSGYDDYGDCIECGDEEYFDYENNECASYSSSSSYEPSSSSSYYPSSSSGEYCELGYNEDGDCIVNACAPGETYYAEFDECVDETSSSGESQYSNYEADNKNRVV